jgi:hypothetical protein
MFLKLKRSTSKGRDTYGYNIVSLVNAYPKKRFSTCGGGYDMVGTVLADALSYYYQYELKTLLEKQGFDIGEYMGSGDEAQRIGRAYGAGISKKGYAYVDGGTGVNNVIAIFADAGVTARQVYVKGNIDGFHVDLSKYDEEVI